MSARGWFIACLVITSFSEGLCGEIKDNMYESISGVAACFRRLNGTHQFGCASGRSGSVGVIHFIEDKADRDWLLQNGTNTPYMVALPQHMFTRETMMSLKYSKRVNGVILFDNGTLDMPKGYSHEDVCPNRYSGLSSVGTQTCSADKPWNPFGTGLMLVDWGFPIFYTDSKENISALYECYKKFNAAAEDGDNNPLCALEMNSFMFAAVDSKTCFHRSSITSNLKPIRYCDALGDRNVWWSLFPRSKRSPANENGSVIIVAAQMDGTSMFDGKVPGSVAPVSAIVTLLATAQFLSHMLPSLQSPEENGTNVLFVLFNGESYDYIGSSRMLWDMQQKKFPVALDEAVYDQPPPLELSHIGLFVELSQLSNHDDSELYFHSFRPKNSLGQRPLVEVFMNQTSSVGAEYGLSFSSVGGVPPSSLQTFLAADTTFPGLVVTSHGDQFNNRFYHSIYDNAENLGYTYQNGSIPLPESIQTFVANVSLSLALSLYKITTKKAYSGGVTANASLVDELFHCYLDTLDCPMFNAATFKQKLVQTPQSMYVGVNVWSNLLTMLTGQLLAYLTYVGELNRTQEECHNDAQNQVYQYFWMLGDSEDGMCVETTMNYSIALSPAFLIPDYDWSSGKYSTWTESVWQELSVRMFLKPSQNLEVLTFALGACVFFLSLIVVFLIDCRSHILFGKMPVAEDC